MIKVCYIIGQLSIGGTEKQLYELVKNIDKKNFQPIIISLSHGGFWSEEIKKLDIELIELKRKKSKEFKRLFHIVWLLHKIKPDIVHTFLFPANSYGRIASIVNRVPVIVSSERNLPELGKDKNTYMILIDKILSFFSDAIICNSMVAADMLVRVHHFNKNKIFVIHNGININQSNISLKENHNFSIGTVCRLKHQKNLKLFIDMARQLLNKKNNLKFIIIGDGPLKSELENYAVKLGLKECIFFLGEKKNVFDFLRKINVFVLTSLYEGLSNAIMEAMISGLPVVATDVGGNRELISNGETGFLCQPNNISDLVEKVMYIIDNPKKAEEMGRNGRVKIINEFSIDKMVKKTENIYLRLLESKKLKRS